jgi:hypothetical protein
MSPKIEKSPLSAAERSRLYRRGLRIRRKNGCQIQIALNNDKIEQLVKLGYLGPNELEDERAIKQAINLFIWDRVAHNATDVATGPKANSKANTRPENL